jgi:ADP-ribose pyrophosphatase YjhB (NUDIX family)
MKFVVTAGVVAERDGKVLIVQEAEHAHYGKFSLPSGHVEPNESIFDAAIRECREETGFDVKLTGLVTVQNLTHRKDGDQHICFFFSAEITGGSEAFDPKEILSVGFFEPSKILAIDDKNFRGKNKDVIKKFFSDKPVPIETVINT